MDGVPKYVSEREERSHVGNAGRFRCTGKTVGRGRRVFSRYWTKRTSSVYPTHKGSLG